LNSNLRQFRFVFLLSLFHLQNHVCLSCGVQMAGVAWPAATRTVTGVGDQVQRTGDDHTGRVLSGQVVERSGDAVCGLHLARGDEERDFLVGPQNQGRQFSLVCPQNQWRRFSPVWPQNWWRWFLPVWPQNRRWVSWLSLKIKVMEGFLVWTSKPAALVW
jgi:hypothetical protein